MLVQVKIPVFEQLLLDPFARQSLTVVGLARAVRELADKARDRKLNPDDVTGSTFTITNPGPFGSYVSLPVINQPNVAILSTASGGTFTGCAYAVSLKRGEPFAVFFATPARIRCPTPPTGPPTTASAS